MTETIDPDALIATFDANDDELDIDRVELITLIATHIAEIGGDSNEFCFSYDICPMHHCDIQICMDDQNPECADLRR